MEANENNGKNAGFYLCENCDFKCSKLSNFNTHVTTAKHKRLIISCQKMPKNADIGVLECICGKNYKHPSSLCKHKKICQDVIQYNLLTKNKLENADIDLTDLTDTDTNIIISSESDIIKKDNLIEYLIKENSEFKGLIMELIKKDSTNNTINNNVNSNNINNNSFNLNVFLNEKCKDAINISEFVDNIQMQLSDLETFGFVGYAEGVSRILIKNLKELDVNQRPVHCSDLKREVIYVKNDNKWSKEDDSNPLFKSAIKQVANKNIKQINEWQKVNPHFSNPESTQNDNYLKIVCNAMSGGSREETEQNYEKIIRNVAKEVVINK